MASFGLSRHALLPRLIRLRDIPSYTGMDRNRFNAELRPSLTEIRIGKQGIAFDRLEVDATIDDYIARNGRPSKKGKSPWDAKDRQDSPSEVDIGTSTKPSTDGEYAEALKQIVLKKPNGFSRG